MKRFFPILLIVLAGCIVQSFHPFYTDKSKVALPQLNGEWDAVTAWGDKVDATNLPPWRISHNEIVAYDNDSKPSKIRVTFFKLGEQLFCDSIAGNIDPNDPNGTKVPSYWVWHTFAVHTVTKVETNRSVLTFKPLDLDWLTNRLATAEVSLSHLTRAEEKDWPLFTAKSADWEKFLTKYAKNTNAFPTNHVYVLKRHTTIPAK
ncbi:MAG: hypothetical protein ABSA97_14565 [Verrucomicrobiia bacterium]